MKHLLFRELRVKAAAEPASFVASRLNGFRFAPQMTQVISLNDDESIVTARMHVVGGRRGQVSELEKARTEVRGRERSGEIRKLPTVFHTVTVISFVCES